MLLVALDPRSIFAERAADLGEPWLSYFEPDVLEAKLRGVGFSNVEFFTPAEANERYFRERPQDLPVPKQVSIVCAVL